MSALTPAPNFPGRLYSKDDLHAAAMVCLDRRDAVLQELTKQFFYLSSEDVRTIVRNVEFLYTCNEQLFSYYRKEEACSQ